MELTLGHVRGLARLCGLGILWVAVDWVMRCLNFATAAWRSGMPFQLNSGDFGTFLFERTGWRQFVGPWFSLALPCGILVVFALFKVRMTWKVAFAVGLSIVAGQWLAELAREMSDKLPSAGWYYFASRLWVVLPGPLAVALASKTKFIEDPAEA